MDPDTLARYIVEFLQRRNGGELREAFQNMRVKDHALMLDELSLILVHGGKPPGWVTPS